MKKKLLLIVATHGDEKIGIEIVKILKRKNLSQYFDYIVANPKALKKNRRFVDFDLNRAYPGHKNSKQYEKRRAYQILKIAKNYEYVIDLHEASSGINNFVIVPRKNITNHNLVRMATLSTVLLWPDPKGPLGNILDNVIEFEFGTKNASRQKTVKAAASATEKTIRRIYRLSFAPPRKQKIYYVYGKLSAKAAPKNKKLVDFKKTTVNGEVFYPLLVGQYIKNGIACYKMHFWD